MTQAPSIKEALERSIVAIDDWLNVYASDLCNQDRVDEANHRISNAGGTLAYIANVQQQNRAALATLQPSGERRDSLGGERRDAIAKELWHRFSPSHHIDWEGETHKGEYLKCADEIISLLRLGWFGSGLVQDEAEWRDISTAPKDGTQILLWYPWTGAQREGAPGGFMYLAKWTYKEDGSEAWIDPTDEDEIGEGATHWKPLPAPPIRSARNGGEG